MNKTFAMFLITLFVFSFAFFVIAHAQQVGQQRKEVIDNPPNCDKKDKGNCQAVCDVHQNPDGSPSIQGCVVAFNKGLAERGVLCKETQALVFVGCDSPSKEQCVNRDGNPGVWCSCYYLCQDLPKQVGTEGIK